MDENIKTRPLRFPAKENPNIYGEGIVRFANCVAEWRQSKISIDFLKVIRHEVF